MSGPMKDNGMPRDLIERIGCRPGTIVRGHGHGELEETKWGTAELVAWVTRQPAPVHYVPPQRAQPKRPRR